MLRSVMLKEKSILLAGLVMGLLLLVESIEATNMTVALSANADESCVESLNGSIKYLEGAQTSSGSKKGEFKTYKWIYPDQRDKQYCYTHFTTPFVLHTLNLLGDNAPLSTLTEVGTAGFNTMKSQAETHLLNSVKSQDGYTGIWDFWGEGEINPLPPDFCTTSCTLEALLTHNSSLWGEEISSDLTYYFKNFMSNVVPGAFSTWISSSTDPLKGSSWREVGICSSTNANVLFFYSSRNKEAMISDTMDWINKMIDNMINSRPYFAAYYRSPLAFTYLVTRAYADGRAHGFLDSGMRGKIRNFILYDTKFGQERDGSWPNYPVLSSDDELETALALVSLLNLGFNELTPSEKGKVRDGITYLLNRQKTDGSWPSAAFYIGYQPSGKPEYYFGSEENTTAICMEAIAKYLLKAQPQTYALVVGQCGTVLKYDYDEQAFTRVPYATGEIEDNLNDVAFEPGGSCALIVGDSGTVLKYEHGILKERTLPTPFNTQHIEAVAWKPDGSYALLVGSRNTVIKYDGMAFTPLLEYNTDRNYSDVAWAPDGSYALIIGSANTVLKYDEAQLEESELDTGHPIGSVAFRPDGSYALLVGMGSSRVKYDGKRFAYEYSPHPGWLTSVAWEPDSSVAYIAGRDGLERYDGGEYRVLIDSCGHVTSDTGWDHPSFTGVACAHAKLPLVVGYQEYYDEGSLTRIEGKAWEYCGNIPYPIAELYSISNLGLSNAAWCPAGNERP